MAKSRHLQAHTALSQTPTALEARVAGHSVTDWQPHRTLGRALPCLLQATKRESMAASKYLFTKRHQTTRKASFRLKIRAKWLLCHTVQRGGCPGATRLPREVAVLCPYQSVAGALGELMAPKSILPCARCPLNGS